MERSNRSWGPFNGRQLTTMVCVVAAMAMFPVGAWAAVSFTNVAITDPGGVNRAKIDSTGALKIGDGSGPLTVDGSTSASLPAKPITIPRKSLGPDPVAVYGPQSKPFGITSVSVLNLCPSAIWFGLLAVTSTGGQFDIENQWVEPSTSAHLVYPSPLVSTPPPGATVTLQAAAYHAPGSCVIMTAVGIQS